MVKGIRRRIEEWVGQKPEKVRDKAVERYKATGQQESERCESAIHGGLIALILMGRKFD